MKKFVAFTLFISVILIIGQSWTTNRNITTSEAAEVEQTVLESYIHGAFNELNPDAMASGFHPDFAIFSANGEQINKYPIARWVDGVRKRKSDPEFDPAKNKWDHNFAILDITGGAAQVKVELSKDGKLVYTDYLSLLQFDSGWKIVAKVYHKHTEN